jgi:hypothetical protein
MKSGARVVIKSTTYLRFSCACCAEDNHDWLMGRFARHDRIFKIPEQWPEHEKSISAIDEEM